jgi:hypothetical protein
LSTPPAPTNISSRVCASSRCSSSKSASRPTRRVSGARSSASCHACVPPQPDPGDVVAGPTGCQWTVPQGITQVWEPRAFQLTAHGVMSAPVVTKCRNDLGTPCP